MTFRTRLVLATTVAVVVAVLAASLGSFLVARNTLLQAADNSLTTAAQKIVAGQEIGSTTATAGPGDRHHRRRGLGRRPPRHRAGAAGRRRPRPRPSSPPSPSTGTRCASSSSTCRRARGPARACLSTAARCRSPRCSTSTRSSRSSRCCWGRWRFIGVLLAVVAGLAGGPHRARPARTRSPTPWRTWPRRPTSRVGSRPGGPDELGRLRRTFNRLLEALESSRRAQSQLVLDASHELRTPLTSLRTNLEVIRRVDELSAEDRSVLVDDVLVQLQELTDLVGDLAELARGDQRAGGAASRCASTCSCSDEVAVQNTHGRAKDVRFELERRAVLGGGPRRRPRPGRGQPARQRPQVEPARRSRCRSSAGTARSSCTTTAPASPRPTCPTSSTASTARRPPGACPARVSAWPSWPRWSRPRAGPSWPRTTPPAGPA